MSIRRLVKLFKKISVSKPLFKFAILSGVFVLLFQNCGSQLRSVMNQSSMSASTVQSAANVEITFQPTDQVAYVGETIYLTVGFETRENITIQWYKNKMAIPGATTTTLLKRNVTLADSGNYSVIIATEKGLVESKVVQVTIINPPTLDVAPAIQTQPQEVTARLGETAVLSVMATGYPSPTYKWFHDDIEIPGQTMNSLQLANIQMAAAGRYYVKVTNYLGSLNSAKVPVTVTEVIEAVKITTPLRHLTKTEGDMLGANQFCVVATGGALQYSWTRAGSTVNVATTPCLIISTLSSSDAGGYEVTVSNTVSSEKSSATLTVSARQISPVISQAPQSATALVGATHTLSVVAVGNPTPSYQWYKDDLEMLDEKSASLILTELELTDAGKYKVRVYNSVGSVTTEAATLSVQEQEVKPVLVTTVPSTFSVLVGEALLNGQFCVAATGTNLVYTWKKQGALALAPYNKGTRCYEISSFMASDAGIYEVKVENSLGSVVSSGALAIAEPSCSILSEQNVEIGSGKKHWNGTSYGECQATECRATYHVEMNTCLPNVKSCSISNGTGEANWNGAGYDVCRLVSCNTPTYVQSGTTCVLASSTSVFSTTIKPIVENKCLGCHRTGGLAAPMTSSSNFAARYNNINRKLNHTGELPYMPPWYVDNSGSCGNFRLDGGLSSSEKSAILDWLNNPTLVSNGVPSGLEANIPLTAPPVLTLGDDPSIRTARMPQSYTMPAASDEYRCFVLDSVSTTDQYAIAYEMAPGNPAIVHHAILGSFPTAAAEQTAIAKQGQDGRPGYQCFGDLGEAEHVFIWAPGRNTQFFPPGTGVKILGGRRLVVQIHYNRAAAMNYTDQSSVRLKLVSAVSAPAKWWMISNLDSAIPARNSNYSTSHTDTVSQALTIYGYFPHMHLYGKTIKTELTSQNKCLINIPNWDFHFQLSYFPTEPINLNVGDSLKTTCVYDSSSSASVISPGYNSNQEMCLNFMYVSTVKSTQKFSTEITGSSGTTTSKSLDVRLIVDSLHKKMSATVFVQMRLNSVNYYLRLDQSGKLNDWVVSSASQPSMAYQSFVELPNYVDMNIFTNFNLSAFNGAKISIGYGMGATAAEAFTEMTQNNRIKSVFDVQ